MPNTDTTQQKRTRAEQARMNGSKSKGPKTEAGKARSARNAENHGAYSGESVCINLLTTESLEAYYHLRSAWSARLRPQCPVEAQLVDRIADCYWRLARAIQHETVMLQHQMEIDAAEYNRAYDCLSADERENRRSALAADSLRQTNRGLDYHLRIQTTLERQIQRLMKQLKDLRDNFPLAVAQPIPDPDLFGRPSNETNPTAPESVDNTPAEPGQEITADSSLAQTEGLTSQPSTVERVVPSHNPAANQTNPDETNPNDATEEQPLYTPKPNQQEAA